MSGIALAGAKGSPGATTLAFGLAAARTGEAVLVELDPDGGGLAARLGTPEDPGLASLAAATRHGTMDGRPDDHTQIARGLRFLPVPSSPRQARACLAAAVQNMDIRMWWASRHCIADCGRLDADSPVREVVKAASVVLWVTRPSLEGTDAVGVRLAELPELFERSRLVTAGEGPYRPEEVSDALGVPLIGHLPFDAGGAARLWNDPGSRRWHRSPLGRAVAGVASVLASTAGVARAPSPLSDGGSGLRQPGAPVGGGT